MRRLLTYLSVAAFTFCLGSSAQRLRPDAPPPASDHPLPVSLCELITAPGRYDGQVVEVRAVLNRNGGEPFISDSSCASRDARVPVEAWAGAMPPQGLPEWATYTTFCGNDPYPATVAGWAADGIFVGTFKAGYPDPGDAHAASQPFIIAKSFLQLTRASRRQ